MGVLILANNFPPMVGGVAEFSHQIAFHLHSPTDQVCVVAPPQGPEDEEWDQACPYTVKRLGSLCPGRGLTERFLALRRVVRECEPVSVILSTHLWSEPHIGRIVAHLSGRPFVLCAHGRELRVPMGLGGRIKRRLAVRFADLVVANSVPTRCLVEQLGVSPESVTVVPLGVDECHLRPVDQDRFKDLTRRFRGRDQKILLTVGRLVQRKGVDRTIQALPAILKSHPDVHYLIVGEGPYRSALEELVFENGLGENVTFVGAVPREDLGLYYELSDVFIMPNRQLSDGDVEGFGIVFLEAGAHKKAVIGGNSGGARDAVLDGTTGLLVDPERPAEIAAAVHRLLENDDVRAAMGEAGYRRVSEEFRWTVSADVLRTEFDRLLLRRNRGRKPNNTKSVNRSGNR